MCAKVNGCIAIQPSFGVGIVVPKSVMYNPEAYVNAEMAAKYTDLLSNNQQFLKADEDNFIIRKTDIKRIYHNPEKKWAWVTILTRAGSSYKLQESKRL